MLNTFTPYENFAKCNSFLVICKKLHLDPYALFLVTAAMFLVGGHIGHSFCSRHAKDAFDQVSSNSVQ